MPYRKYNRKRYNGRKKQYHKKRYNRMSPTYGLRTSILGSPGDITPIARTMKGNFKWNATVGLTPPGVLTAQNIFTANGMFDPDISGGTHKPRGFDQLLALYDHYVVIASSIQVTFCNTDSAQFVACGIAVTDSTASPGTIVAYMESPDCVYEILAPHLSGSDMKTVRRGISPPKWLGSGKSPLSNDLIQGSTIANPLEQAYYQIWVGSIDGFASSVVHCVVEINYTAILKEPQNPGAS